VPLAPAEAAAYLFLVRSMPRFPGPYNEPGRKSDYYMPRNNVALDDYSFLKYVCRDKREERYRPAGKDPFQESLEHALRGVRHSTQVSSLRGTLRKAIIQLAIDIHASDAQREKEDRLQMRIAALEKMLGVLQGYKVVSEQREGRTVWCRRLER
jgi:hypothetical protein